MTEITRSHIIATIFAYKLFLVGIYIKITRKSFVLRENTVETHRFAGRMAHSEGFIITIESRPGAFTSGNFINGGMSGSPAIDPSTNRVVGIQVAGLLDVTDNHGDMRAISSRITHVLIDTVNALRR